ncbi:hypothetical protein NDU88_003697 [Pleurodeles waltl]|uniref:Uncharacterized protein n=1 Tax=Pleurodeles waltl TaxID=8319 RepID=A0AAV7UH25_PLEWA|nr:hypothetical protein NDU88_003697 [Pleurodeles waltl]
MLGARRFVELRRGNAKDPTAISRSACHPPLGASRSATVRCVRFVLGGRLSSLPSRIITKELPYFYSLYFGTPVLERFQFVCFCFCSS